MGFQNEAKIFKSKHYGLSVHWEHFEAIISKVLLRHTNTGDINGSKIKTTNQRAQQAKLSYPENLRNLCTRYIYLFIKVTIQYNKQYNKQNM